MMIRRDVRLNWLFRTRPGAAAHIRGSSDYPKLNGMVRFYASEKGVYVLTDISGLPGRREGCEADFFAMHIHMGGRCSGSKGDPFSDTGMHYNPGKCPHPAHAGDLPPLLSNQGNAWSVFLSDRFSLPEIIGKTVVIHENPDDFHTQPSGNSGKKIGCGVIWAL